MEPRKQLFSNEKEEKEYVEHRLSCAKMSFTICIHMAMMLNAQKKMYASDMQLRNLGWQFRDSNHPWVEDDVSLNYHPQ